MKNNSKYSKLLEKSIYFEKLQTAVFIGKGNISGKAVYANRDFEKGDIVLVWRLKQISEEEYNSLSRKIKLFTHKHPDGNFYLYSYPEKYVNNSSTPNTLPDYINGCDIAIKYIHKGEKITTSDFDIKNKYNAI